jgi:hypothetical protein
MVTACAKKILIELSRGTVSGPASLPGPAAARSVRRRRLLPLSFADSQSVFFQQVRDLILQVATAKRDYFYHFFSLSRRRRPHVSDWRWRISWPQA